MGSITTGSIGADAWQLNLASSSHASSATVSPRRVNAALSPTDTAPSDDFNSELRTLPMDYSTVEAVSLPHSSAFQLYLERTEYVPPPSPVASRRRIWAEYFTLSADSDLSRAILDGDTVHALEVVSISRKKLKLLKIGQLSAGLRLAALFGQKEVVKAILKQGIKPKSDRHGLSALHCAAFGGCKDTVKLLLEYNASASIVSQRYSTPLCLAVLAGRLNVIEVLLRYGSSVSLDGGRFGSAIHAACATNQDHLAEALSERVTGGSLFRNVDLEAIQSIINLLETGDNTSTSMPLIVDGQKTATEDRCRIRSLGCQPLALAAYFGHVSTVKHLTALRPNGVFESCAVGCKADDQLPTPIYNRKVHTALTLAAACGHLEVMDTLLDRGAALTTSDQGDENALWYATLNQHTACALLLVQRGAPSNQKIWKYAKATEQHELMDAILERRIRRSQLHSDDSAYWATCGSYSDTTSLLGSLPVYGAA